MTDMIRNHFFNTRDTVVTDALDGLLLTSAPDRLARLASFPAIKVILRADWDRKGVALISGGGAGHEPSHAGLVGKGMLTAAVSGEIFASPSVDAVLAAIRVVTGSSGCLLIVKNYTGDRLNFGLAAEQARAEGYRVEMVIVADDIAIPDSAQPRGVAGTLFVHKIAGHLAEGGADLATIAEKARSVARDAVSFGASLSSCSIPGQAFSERLAGGEGELGLGIHGEPGVERFIMLEAQKLVATMVTRLDSALPSGGEYALLINNLGAVPPLEMSLIAREVLQSQLGARVKLVIGPAAMMTALNMNGFSLSLLRLDADREAALLEPVSPEAWPAAKRRAAIRLVQPQPSSKEKAAALPSANAAVQALLTKGCDRLIALEADLNRLDARIGDGDTGSTLADGARSIRAALPDMPLADIAGTLLAIGRTLATTMGGSSGVLLSIFFTAAAGRMAAGTTFPEALSAGLDRMTFYGGANPGDRTMVDALAPALAHLASTGLPAAASAARQGALATQTMKKAKAGRSAYLSAHDLDGVMDPGAAAVAEIFEALAGG